MESNNLTPNFADLENPSTIIDEIEKVKEEVITGNAKNELIKATLEALEIKATDEIEPPKIAWEQINGNYSATLGTLGNFSLIIGKAKSRKSSHVDLMNYVKFSFHEGRNIDIMSEAQVISNYKNLKDNTVS
jgi:hypothetical protein